MADAPLRAPAVVPRFMKISLETKSGDYQFDCHEGETLLVAGLASGLTLPYECASGTCGTCRGRVMGGTVEAGWADAPGYARLHRAKGDVLMCQARPTSDCVLRVPAQVARNAAIDPARMQRKGTLANLSQLTHDVIEFEVALSAPMSFAAGQFVTVHTPDVVGHRSYSMVNYADAVDRLAFVVKRKPGGKFSDWLFDRAKPGADLDITGPLGRATFRPEEARGILCIAGGSGIAGMMSILEHARRIDYVAKGHHAHVFFGVRTLQDAFYVEDFNSHVDASGGRLEVTLALSHEDSHATRHPAFPHVRLASGMVHEVAARAMIGRYDNLTAFVAGPAPMVDAALRVLITEGQLPGRFIRYDKFA